jgi:phage tail sheath protein FI
MVFTALEPTDIVPMALQVANVNSAKSTFDLVITYGKQRIETYRGVGLSDASIKAVNTASALVQVSQITAGSWGSTLPAAGTKPFPNTPSNLPSGYVAGFLADDFLTVFEANSPLDNLEIFNLLLVPSVADNSVVSAAFAFAERKRAFAILDPPPGAPAFGAQNDSPQPIQYWMSGLGGVSSGYQLPRSQNGALYFPYIVSNDPVTGNNIPMPPSGFVAGVYASTDTNRGVWKAPAGLQAIVLNTTGPVANGVMNDPQQGVLNLDAINALRSFAGTGTVVWGARTTVASNTAFQQSMYVPVRRMTLFIEQTLLANLRWVVFEPNDEPLWLAIVASISAFMLSLFRQGALQGSTPSEAFQVKCDSTTTSPTDQANGIVNIVVAFAPLKPAEFVVIQIAQLAGQTTGS